MKTIQGSRLRSSRRSFLRAGTAAFLLEPLVRATWAEADGAPPRRLVLFVYANGAPHTWGPSGAAEAFTLTPATKSLEAIRRDVVIVRNLEVKWGDSIQNPHEAGGLACLTGASGYAGATSVDQAIGASLRGTGVPFPTLELEVANGKRGSCNFANGTQITIPDDPVEAYRRLVARVGGSAMPSQPAPLKEHLARKRSVLDYAARDVMAFQRSLGGLEKQRVEEVLEGLRRLEERLGSDATPAPPSVGCTVSAAPTATRDLRSISRTNIELAVMALSCGLTRVVTLSWGGREQNDPITWLDPPTTMWHNLGSHYDDGSAMLTFMERMNDYLCGELVYLVNRLKAVRVGDQTLFDSTLSVMLTQMGRSNAHWGVDAPFILAGHWNRRFATGRLVDAGAVRRGNGPFQNDLLTTLARGMGLDVAKYGTPTWCRGPLAVLG